MLPLDVTDRAAVLEAMARAHAHFGRLDVILSNAGYGYMSAVQEIDIAAAKANFETNVWGTLHVIHAALPYLRAQGSGHILPLSSIAGMVSLPTGGSYIASKWGVEALSEGLAGEVSGFGLKVTKARISAQDPGRRRAPAPPARPLHPRHIAPSLFPANSGETAAMDQTLAAFTPKVPLRDILTHACIHFPEPPVLVLS